MNFRDQLDFDREHIWHPYSTTLAPPPVFHVQSASGVRLRLSDGRESIDGMASWWSAIHGYNHPTLNNAIESQLQSMAHVMFGGLTHEPAVTLAEQLIAITPPSLSHVFFADSGSVAVEVAIKMALQYWSSQQRPEKNRLMTVHGGYHGDTMGAMAVCDPNTGMHHLFASNLPQHIFAPRPSIRYGDQWDPSSMDSATALINQHAESIAAVIIEPIVQGAGGMWFYHPQYLRELAALCKAHDVLLICDEIATGFGRSGELFAVNHSEVEPDICCIGKGLTGGYLTLAATLATANVAHTISSGDPGVFMHGPTFMANPLACRVASASIKLLLSENWQANIQRIEKALQLGLEPCRDSAQVADVRVLGAIGVVELHQPVDMHKISQAFVARGVWVRPFGKLVYVMPPYLIDDADLSILTKAICAVVRDDLGA